MLYSLLATKNLTVFYNYIVLLIIAIRRSIKPLRRMSAQTTFNEKHVGIFHF